MSGGETSAGAANGRSGPLRSILIVGGGTAGWMAAAFLGRVLRRHRTRVTLVESPDIGTIGVGEATIPSLVAFIRALGLDEAEFMRRCGATYKLGIRFVDWVGPGRDSWHMFGLAGARPAGHDLFHFWFRQRLADEEPRSYPDYSVHALLAAAEKAPRPVAGSSTIIDQGTYAYHVDAGLFAQYLREVATAGGVAHLYGQVAEVVRDEAGDIRHVDIGGGRTLEADFFVDCTGFRGVLAEEALGDRWIDWSDRLLCDRAVVMPLPAGPDMPSYTRSTASEAGWMWRIPLSHRTGCGYVHSSAHTDEERAAETLIRVADLKRARTADPRFLRMRIGRRTSFWTRNCLAVGLASGFVEPLESTGLHIVSKALELFLDYLPDRAGSETLRRAFNRRMGDLYDEIRDFIILHYLVAGRTEPFWRDARSVALPDSLAATLELYDEAGRIEPRPDSCFADTNWYYILAEAGRLPRRAAAPADLAPPAEIRALLDGIVKRNAAFAAQMPPHAAVIAALRSARVPS